MPSRVIRSRKSEHPRPLRVVMAAMEMTPVVKVGGLGDAVEGISRALAERGHEVTVILPHFQALEGHWPVEALPHAELVPAPGSPPRRQRFHRLRVPGHPARVWLLEDPAFTTRPGIYVDPVTREEYPDAGDRYALFSRGVLEILLHADLAPDVLHVHDYQVALIPTLIKRAGIGERFFGRTHTVLSIHNLGFHGVYEPSVLDRIGLGRDAFYPGGPLEFWGRVNFLKAGIVDASTVSTVSPQYASEMRTSAEYGHGLEGVLASRGDDLVGILNGIDTEVWNPGSDPLLAAGYRAGDLRGKRVNRSALLDRTGLSAQAEQPVVGMVSRLTDQKGIDLVRSCAPALLEKGIGLVVLGSGDLDHERFFHTLALSRPGRVFYSSAFDDPLAHLIYAGADVFLMPSRYEPCGIGQMIAMRYGTVPVVRRTGGLADTVISVSASPETGTGFLFDEFTPEALRQATEAAVAAFADPPRWRAIVRRCLEQDFSWSRAGEQYERLYRRGASGNRSGLPAG